jgi:hypothetical protein
VKAKFSESVFHEFGRIRSKGSLRERADDRLARYTPSNLLLGPMHFVPEDRRRRGVWRSVPQGTLGAVELRLVYLEFELERRLVGHERVLKTFLESSRIP